MTILVRSAGKSFVTIVTIVIVGCKLVSQAVVGHAFNWTATRRWYSWCNWFCKFDLHVVHVTTMFNKGLSSIEVTIARHAVLVFGISHVSLRRVG